MLRSEFWLLLLFFVIKLFTSSSIADSSFCKSNDDCLNNKTICVNSTCECIEGFIYSGDKTKCLEIARNFGAACEESQQCSEFLSSGGRCSRGFCNCAVGFHYLHGQCWKSLNIGDKCLSLDNCYVNFEVDAAGCYENVCKCSEGFYHREYRSCRRRATGEGADCAIDLDCQYETTKNVTCDETKKCIESSNMTMIKPDYEQREIGEINHDDFSYQNDGIDCPRAHFYSNEVKKCIAEIGEKCEPAEEPLIKNSICLNNKWKCKAAFVPMKNNRICVEATTQFLNSCSIDEQCYLFGPDAECTLHRCNCNYKSHFIEEELFCWITKRPGENCKVDYDCYDHGSGIESKCVDNICNCPIGYHINSKNRCVQDVEAIGDRCSENADCEPLPNATCIDNVCLCVDNYYEVSGKCVAGIKTFCDNSTICKPKNSYCEDGICICYDEFVAISPGLCAPIADNGENCSNSLQCTAFDPHSICSTASQVCECEDTFFFNYGKCFRRKVLGEICENIAECFVTSHPSTVVCENGICMCNEMEKFDETFCGNGATIVSTSIWIALCLIILETAIFI